jgi:hypothetical protein
MLGKIVSEDFRFNIYGTQTTDFFWFLF